MKKIETYVKRMNSLSLNTVESILEIGNLMIDAKNELSTDEYKEFLKIDFPRVPYPKDKDTFWKLVKMGGEIRQIHLLESAVVDKPICKFNISGTDVVAKPKYENGNVYINRVQK